MAGKLADLPLTAVSTIRDFVGRLFLYRRAVSDAGGFGVGQFYFSTTQLNSEEQICLIVCYFLSSTLDINANLQRNFTSSAVS